MPSLYISPAGSGDKSGSDINNAASIGSLNTLIGKAGPGGEVLLLADQGDYKVTGIIGVTRGGAEGQPVVVRGIDSAGNSMAAYFTGSRPADWQAGDASGNELFKLGTGADNLEFRDLRIDNVGTAFRVTADISSLHIENIDANNVRRFFEDYASAPSGTKSRRLGWTTTTPAEVSRRASRYAGRAARASSVPSARSSSSAPVTTM